MTDLRNRINSLRYRLFLLWVLNILDALLTYYLMQTGCFIEANFLMRRFVQNIFLFFGIKVLAPAFLILLIYNRIGNAGDTQIKTANILIYTGLLFYIAVVFINILWAVIMTL